MVIFMLDEFLGIKSFHCRNWILASWSTIAYDQYIKEKMHLKPEFSWLYAAEL